MNFRRSSNNQERFSQAWRRFGKSGLIALILFAGLACATSIEAPTLAPTRTPLPSQTATSLPPTITPTVKPTQARPNCKEFPGLPGCAQALPLTRGRLAYRASSSQVLVLDLGQGQVWRIPTNSLRLVGWSPSGNWLLIEKSPGDYAVMRVDGSAVQAYTGLVQPAFWAPVGGIQDPGDWLALPQSDGSLQVVDPQGGERRLVLPAGSLGPNGQAQLVWAPGQPPLVATSAGQLKVNQLIVQRLANGAETLTLSLNAYQTYFALIDGVPGSPLLLAGMAENCPACGQDGLPLVSIQIADGTVKPLGLDMLLKGQAYAWNPVQPGLAAVAAGLGRSINKNKRLALLDVPSASFTYLTGSDLASFEPAWSPDGRWLAYAALASGEGTMGDVIIPELHLAGREIYRYDSTSGETELVTFPGPSRVDGWPHWSGGGRQLLYARLAPDEGKTEVRIANLELGSDELLFTIPRLPQGCLLGGCAWDEMLAFYPEKMPPPKDSSSSG